MCYCDDDGWMVLLVPILLGDMALYTHTDHGTYIGRLYKCQGWSEVGGKKTQGKPREQATAKDTKKNLRQGLQEVVTPYPCWFVCVHTGLMIEFSLIFTNI